jgi:ABC-type polysaccharide/polyol phosphate export permease
MVLFRLLVVVAAFSSGEAFTPGVHAPAVRRVAAISPVMPTVMMVRAILLRSGHAVALAHTLQCRP